MLLGRRVGGYVGTMVLPLRALARLGPPLAVVALVLLPLAACGGDDDSATSDTTTTTTTTEADATTTTGGDTTTTTTEPDRAAPDTIAAVLGDGSLAVVDAETGEVRERLLDGIDVSDPAKNGIAVAPDGEEIFVVRPAADTAVEHDIVRVPVDGSDSEVVVQGRAPAVSPDGATLAYVAVDPDASPGQPDPVIVLRDLQTGDQHELRRMGEPGFPFIADLAWTADGEHVSFVAGEIQTGLYIVRTDADSLDDADRLGPDNRGEDTSWTAVTPFDDERLAVVETCCGVPDEERWHVIAVHLPSGSVEGTLLPDERVEASVIDSDASTRHFVMVTDLRPGGGTLLRWSSPQGDDGVSTGGALEEVRGDVVVAAW